MKPILPAWRKLAYALSWLPVAAIQGLLILIGALIAVPIALFIQDLATVLRPNRVQYWPPPLWLWGNALEGCPEWWLADVRAEYPPDARERRYREPSGRIARLLYEIRGRFPRWWWFAVRNPVGNFRLLLDDYQTDEVNVASNWMLDEPMEAPMMRVYGQRCAWRWAWRGAFAGYRRVWLTDGETPAHATRYTEIWLGWKIGSSVPGLGFTMQWRPNIRIGM